MSALVMTGHGFATSLTLLPVHINFFFFFFVSLGIERICWSQGLYKSMCVGVGGHLTSAKLLKAIQTLCHSVFGDMKAIKSSLMPETIFTVFLLTSLMGQYLSHCEVM